MTFKFCMFQGLLVLMVLCDCAANVWIHTKALVRPLANTHVEAWKHLCSAG